MILGISFLYTTNLYIGLQEYKIKKQNPQFNSFAASINPNLSSNIDIRTSLQLTQIFWILLLALKP